MPYIWILTCVLGLTCLQATEISIDSLEGGCKERPQLIVDTPVRVAPDPVFAFVYTNNSLTERETTSLGFRDAYFTKSQPVFTSRGAAKKIAYDSKTGELIVSSAGSYKIVYSMEVDQKTDQMALAVNGKVIPATKIRLSQQTIITGLFVLALKAGDRISMRHISGDNEFVMIRNEGVGNSLSLFVQKM